ncbi:MAG: hypothetical protein KF761_11190 [Salinibacterium sp.]|nr:hypothetical protein [Salinibacterium sp.]
MSETTPPSYSQTYGQVKTLAVRVSEDLRAQLDIIAQLNDRTVTEEIRLALEAWIEKSKSDPSVLKRAESVRAEIEREATTKRNAISAIFDGATAKPKTPTRSSAAKEGS